MSIRSYAYGQNRRLGGKDLKPDYEAILMAQKNRERGNVEAKKVAITIDASTRGLEKKQCFISTTLEQAKRDNAALVQLEKELEQEEALRSRRDADQLVIRTYAKDERMSGKESKRRGKGRKPKPRPKQNL